MKRWTAPLAALTLAATALLPSSTASAAPAADGSIAGITGVGVHNAYVQATFPWMVDALESGASMLELDVWQNFLGSRAYQVGHDPGNANNCSSATTFANLRTGSRNQSFQTCLRNIRLWHDQNPNHAPVILKIEMKNGFDGRSGFGPAQFDTLLTNALGAGAILHPAQVKGSASTLDAAVRAGAWPSRDSLRGKFVILAETGAFEAQNPFDTTTPTSSTPTVQQATDRLHLLAAHGATIISSDWINPAILSLTTPRS